MSLVRCRSIACKEILPNRLFSTVDGYQLKCGLEIHTQLNTRDKLFSFSTNNSFAAVHHPNIHTSYFDIALPGTRPILNYEAVLSALKLGLAIDGKVNTTSHFDRKHYFYGDQPQGYQITQHYVPIVKGGRLILLKNIDNIKEDRKEIRIIQLQLEQDTGRSLYQKADNMTLIDLNRSNLPLIELVTEPDFSDAKQVRAFVKKYQDLVRQLGISTGDLETGSLRVDVNINVNEFPRVELKNLPNTSSIVHAIQYEYKRQVNILLNGEYEGERAKQETRGWDGKKTIKLRTKETTIDYRYMPDPELPVITINQDVIKAIKKTLPMPTEEKINIFVNDPYNLSFKDAKILTIHNELNPLYNNEDLKDYYVAIFTAYSNNVGKDNINSKLVVSWVIHELLGYLNKLEIPLSKVNVLLTPKKFASFLTLIHTEKLSKTSAKLLLFHILEEFKQDNFVIKSEIDFSDLIKKFNISAINTVDQNALESDCLAIVKDIKDQKMLEAIISGKKKNSLNFLIGLGMRKYQGRIQSDQIKKAMKKVLNIEW